MIYYTILVIWCLTTLFVLVYRDSMNDKDTLGKRNDELLKWLDGLWPGKLVKEIVSKDGELHFRRWRIFESKTMNLYVHKIYKADEDLHLHNHPWNFAVVCLSGSYAEEVEKDKKRGMVFVRPWTFRMRTKEDFHKIRRMFSECVTTLVLTWGEKTVWGYDVSGKFVDFETYRFQKNFDTKTERYYKTQADIEELRECGRMLKVKSNKPEDILKAIVDLQKENAELEKKINENKQNQ